MHLLADNDTRPTVFEKVLNNFHVLRLPTPLHCLSVHVLAYTRQWTMSPALIFNHPWQIFPGRVQAAGHNGNPTVLLETSMSGAEHFVAQRT